MIGATQLLANNTQLLLAVALEGGVA